MLKIAVLNRDYSIKKSNYEIYYNLKLDKIDCLFPIAIHECILRFFYDIGNRRIIAT